MKKLLVALYVATLSTMTWASCVTHTVYANGKYVTCTTCCYGNNCTTTCY